MIVKNESERWQVLYRITRELYRHDPLNLSNLLEEILGHIGQYTQLRSGCIVTFQDNGDVADAFTLDLDMVGNGLWEHLFTKGLLGFVHHSQRTIIIRNIARDPRWPAPPDKVPAPREGSAIGVPIQIGGKPLGVMMFTHPEIDGFGTDGQAILEEIAGLISQAKLHETRQRTARDEGERYQWLFEDAITPVILTDLRGQVIKANREASRFLGYAPEKMETLNIRDIYDARQRKSQHGGDTSLKTNRLSAYETNVASASGANIPVRLKMRKRSFRGDPVIEYVMQDIRTEVELNQLRQDLTAMVFHDLRGPLQNIRFGLVALRRMLPEGNHNIDTILAGADTSAQQLNRMISSLLDIQRLEGSRTILNRRVQPLSEIIQSAVDQTNAIIAAANLKLELALPDVLPIMNADADMLSRVMTNLIENAVKYASTGGTVKLSAVKEVNQIHLIVSDDGPGIPPEMRDRIFDKFSRVKYDTSTSGVGLGLAFCRLAVEAHEGRIWVESEVNHGAQFHFTIPVDENLQKTGQGSTANSVTVNPG